MPKNNVNEVINELDASIAGAENPLRNAQPGTLDYIKDQLRTIANTPDRNQACQAAYDLMRDQNDSMVGTAVAQTLLMRPDGVDCCCDVGSAVVKAELEAPGMRPDSFVRGREAINGFSKAVVLEATPGLEQGIREDFQGLRQQCAAHLAQGEMTPGQRLDFEADLTNSMMDLTTKHRLSPDAEKYLKATKDTVLSSNAAYDSKIQNYLGEEADQQAVENCKASLAESFTNNSSALRIINPIVAELRDGEQSWGNANQMAQKIINGYQNDQLNNLSERFRPLGEKAFTPENKQKVAAMHEAVDNAPAHQAQGVDFAAGSELTRNDRQQRLAEHRENAQQNLQNAAPAVNADDHQPAHSSRFGSVRDALRGAASRVSDAASSLKNSIADKLEQKGGEQRLRDVPEEAKNAYKELQKQLSDLKKFPAADGVNAIDAALGDADAYDKFKKGSPEIAEMEKDIKARMAEMKEENPGLAQLDRNKVEQFIHSETRDAARSVANKIR